MDYEFGWIPFAEWRDVELKAGARRKRFVVERDVLVSTPNAYCVSRACDAAEWVPDDPNCTVTHISEIVSPDE